MLHPGEFVLRKETVQAVGQRMLDQVNRRPQSVGGAGVGTSARPVTVNFNIRAFDGPSTARWWRANQGRIVQAVRKAIGDRAL